MCDYFRACLRCHREQILMFVFPAPSPVSIVSAKLHVSKAIQLEIGVGVIRWEGSG